MRRESVRKIDCQLQPLINNIFQRAFMQHGQETSHISDVDDYRQQAAAGKFFHAMLELVIVSGFGYCRDGKPEIVLELFVNVFVFVGV